MSVEFDTVKTDGTWDQRCSLKPPPYEGALKPYLKGIEIGDPIIDSFPASQLACHGQKLQLEIPLQVLQIPEPAWVDWEQIRRGQKLWQKHLGRAYFALGHALLIGFSISRFAEVLHFSGYAQSAATAFERYRETGFAIIDWFRFPLDDPSSIGRKQIYRVRLMHAFARRKATKLFDKSKGEGVALSQYDMAEVLLGFSAVSIYFMKTALGVSISPAEEADMVACWRLIGFHLGIQDEFNLCKSVEHLHECFEDYMVHTRARVATCRKSTQALQQTAVEGFGMGTGLGAEAWWGSLQALKDAPVWDGSNVCTRPANSGMQLIGALMHRVFRYDFFNNVTAKYLVLNREEWREGKPSAKRKLKVLSYIGAFYDMIIWKLFSLMYRLRQILAIYLVYQWLNSARSKRKWLLF